MPRALASVRARVSSRPAVWEINWWDGEARAGQHIFTNQTITSAAGAKDVSPVWLGSVVDGVLSYTMRGNMCGFPMAMGDIVYEWFSFPKNDSFQEFCMKLVGGKIWWRKMISDDETRRAGRARSCAVRLALCA